VTGQPPFPPTAGGLRRFLEPRRPKVVPGEACEFCAEELHEDHRHVVNLESRSLACACRGCALLFEPDGAGRGRYRTVPEGTTREPGFRIPDDLWEELQIPVGMAFFFVNSSLGRPVAFYPSPAGATESLLPLGSWDRLVAAGRLLDQFAPDVEALLVRRVAGGFESYRVPIDRCYELVGLIRRTWKGFDGGSEARDAIDGFFGRLHATSRVVRPTTA